MRTPSEITGAAVAILTVLVMQLLTLALLVVLKLAGVGTVATWSWWLVAAPIWGPWALVLLGFALYILAEHYED